MKAPSKIVIVIVGGVIAVVSARMGSHLIFQHRAIYPGGLTFVGNADGLLGSRYHRVFLWRAVGETRKLPEVYIHIAGAPHALRDLTPQDFIRFGGAADEGALYDQAGSVLQYRFEGDGLTWLSLDPGFTPVAPLEGGNLTTSRFALSRDAGTSLALPVSHDGLIAALGEPERTDRVFAQ